LKEGASEEASEYYQSWTLEIVQEALNDEVFYSGKSKKAPFPGKSWIPGSLTEIASQLSSDPELILLCDKREVIIFGS